MQRHRIPRPALTDTLSTACRRRPVLNEDTGRVGAISQASPCREQRAFTSKIRVAIRDSKSSRIIICVMKWSSQQMTSVVGGNHTGSTSSRPLCRIQSHLTSAKITAVLTQLVGIVSQDCEQVTFSVVHIKVVVLAASMRTVVRPDSIHLKTSHLDVQLFLLCYYRGSPFSSQTRETCT